MSIDELYSIYRQNPGVQTDTRKLKPNDIFFALKGPNFNGNTYAETALDMGAAIAVIDDKAYYTRPDKMMLVEDVLHTLQELALWHRMQLNIPIRLAILIIISGCP
jgi:UDP-N-acetylmuramoyl-tripeptide--D-alanyl-D-alanine ligase